MAEEKEVIIDVKVDTGEVTERLTEVNNEITMLKATNAALKKSMKENGETFQLNTKLIAENEKKIKLLQGESKSLTGQLQSQTKANAALGDSYNEINARVNQLQKEYKSLSAEQRESAGGKEMLKQIDEQKKKLKEIDATLGDHFRNVGNYAGSLNPAFQKLDGTLSKFGTSVEDIATGGMQAIKGAFSSGVQAVKSFSKSLLATPIGAVLIAITALKAGFDKLKEAIAKNDYAGTELEKLWSSLKPVTVLLNKALEAMANTLGFLASQLSKVIAYFSDASAAQQQLVVDADNLEEKERQYTVNKASRESKIAELRANAALREKYSAEERLKMMDEADALEKANLEEAKKIAAEKIRLRQAEADNAADTSDATANEIAQLQADYLRLDTEYNAHVRRLNSNRTTFLREIEAEDKAAADAAKAAAQERADAAKAATDAEIAAAAEAKAIEIDIAKQLQDELLAGMEEGYEKQREAARINGEREIQDLEAKYANQENLTAEAKDQLNQLIIAKKKNLQSELDNIDAEEAARKAEEEAAAAEREQAVWDEVTAMKNERTLSEDELALENLKLAHEEKMATIQEQLQGENELTAGEKEALNALLLEQQQTYEAQKAEIIAEAKKRETEAAAQSAQQSLSAFGNLLDGVSALSKAFGADEKEQAKAQQVLALGKIAVSTGIAIAQGVAQAQSVPFPANIAAIATTVGTVLANIASAISQVKGAKFATGGIVGGNSYSGDKVPINVNSGEMILNPAQQKNLFNIAQNQASLINYEGMAGAFSAALQNQKPPVLVMEEFKSFNAEVAAIEEVSTI